MLCVRMAPFCKPSRAVEVFKVSVGFQIRDLRSRSPDLRSAARWFIVFQFCHVFVMAHLLLVVAEFNPEDLVYHCTSTYCMCLCRPIIMIEFVFKRLIINR